MASQDLVGEHGQSVARVQREAEAELGPQSGPAAATLAAVDDVVVDEEGVVEQLDRDGDRDDLSRRSPPKARHVATQSAGRSAFPGRLGYTRATRYSQRCGSPSGIASSIERRTRRLTSSA